MPELIEQPTVIQAAGNKPKLIEEFIGLANTGNSEVSIARMKSPQGWVEPGQRPKFQEYTVVLSGALHVEHESGTTIVGPGQAIITKPDEWVRYSTPDQYGAEYIAVCLPAFSPESVFRDPE